MDDPPSITLRTRRNSMNAKAKIVPTDDPWDDRSVGAEEQYVEAAPDITAEVDAALDLHPISIRLQKSLVENLKALAHLHGLGYQPLIRQVLTRWVDAEIKQMIIQRAAAVSEEREAGSKTAEKGAGGKQRKAA
jgi:hypothetical protein